ncbi:Replicase family [Edwardsiella ictaluri]|nr:replication initiation protein [Edwardsiella ictaluri]STQ88882.1 Replicase family [Edwardsiella ictaluri]
MSCTLLYALDTAVRTAPDNSSLKALRYAAAIERGLRDKLRADLGYSSLLCKNPLHDYWGVTEWRSERTRWMNWRITSI